MDLKQLIENYLQEARIMQIATVENGKPWVCTVNFAVDNNWNLFWMSVRSIRHSQEIKMSPIIAGAIVKDPTKIQGIQFEGLAEELFGDDILHANDVFEQRYGHKPERLEEAQSNDTSVRAYFKIKPTKIVLFDKIHFPDNPRQEYKI